MTEDNRIPEIRAVLDAYYDPEGNVGTEVNLVARITRIVDREQPAPRVFLPDDQVPVGTVITTKDGSPFRVPDVYASEGLARVGAAFVELIVPSSEEWQAAVDRASEERAISEPTEGQNP